MRFNLKAKRDHYIKVANGTKPVKASSKFSPEEQLAYARGQRDARNEQIRIFAFLKATPEQRAAYKRQKLNYKKNKK